MNPYRAAVIHNVSLMVLVGLAVWLTGSAWALAGLMFYVTVSNCPECGAQFVEEDDMRTSTSPPNTSNSR